VAGEQLMRVERIDVFRANAGWKTHSFMKVVSEGGLVGWSEFSHDFGAVLTTRQGAEPSLAEMSGIIVGASVGTVETKLLLDTFSRRSALARQLAGAVKNAMLDLEARSRGVSVHALLGGAKRDRIPLYWAHCGTYRISHSAALGVPAIRTLDDIRSLGAEVAARGYRALKCNLLLLGSGEPRRFKAERAERLDDDVVTHVAEELASLLAAFHAGAGPDIELLVDIGAGFPVPAAAALARAAGRHGVHWVEMEAASASALAEVRSTARVAVATGERLMPDDYAAYLAAGAADVMVLDLPFLGVRDAVTIAAQCAAHGVPVAPHNCYSPLATMMSAAFCAVAPNLALMEIDVDGVAWENSFVTKPPVIRDGYLEVPEGPGWGTEINEDAVRAHAAEL
jgi:galactonate dehydratase